MPLNPADPTSTEFRDRVSTEIDQFLDLVAARLEAVSPALRPLVRVAGALSAGGKRLRPAFAYWGHVAVAGDQQVPEGLWQAISAIELLHVGVLMHDDVLDAADTRRGLPAAHRQFEAWHRDHGGAGESAEFGRAMAVLLGDQLLVWSGEMAETADLPVDAWQAARGYWHAVRTEVNSGQVLDISAQYGIGAITEQDAESVAAQVLEEKTSRYTVQRPLQFGAAIGGASPEVLDALGRFGLALGRGFQLRDDLLGIFAEAADTGKPAAGDLREGKQTVLMARALANLATPQANELSGMLGQPDLTDEQIDRARTLLTDSGAVDQIEALISQDHAEALAALDGIEITEPGRIALVELARQCVQRSS